MSQDVTTAKPGAVPGAWFVVIAQSHIARHLNSAAWNVRSDELTGRGGRLKPPVGLSGGTSIFGGEDVTVLTDEELN